MKAKLYFISGDNEDETMVPYMERMIYLINTTRCFCSRMIQTKIVFKGKHNKRIMVKRICKSVPLPFLGEVRT